MSLIAPVGAQAAGREFSYTGTQQSFTVPAGVASVHVVAIGGRGGSFGGNGAFGAQVTADLSVTPGEAQR